jgi:hypothetical protein
MNLCFYTSRRKEWSMKKEDVAQDLLPSLTLQGVERCKLSEEGTFVSAEWLVMPSGGLDMWDIKYQPTNERVLVEEGELASIPGNHVLAVRLKGGFLEVYRIQG